MAPIAVDTSKMISAAQEMMNKHDSIRSQVLGLQSNLNSLQGSWKGDTATAFDNAMNGFYDDANTILTQLQTLANNVDTAAKTYEQAHNQTTTDATTLANRIGSTSAGLPGFS